MIMKELSIEEKAKAYDEAIKYAQYLINERCKEDTDGSFHRADLNRMFPKLVENEDERIRKALIDYFRWNPNSQLLNEFSNREVFAYLEKQGNNMGISEATKKKLEDNLNKALEKETPESCNEFLEKQDEQNPTWSEEDERNLNEALSYIKDETLKNFIKNRVQPQLKQEWSSEDKENLLDVKCIIDEVWHKEETTEFSSEKLESLWYWLDNLWKRVEYFQSTWKPSDEQMDALNLAIGEANSVDTAAGDEAAEILTSLYEQLKKLKGE